MLKRPENDETPPLTPAQQAAAAAFVADMEADDRQRALAGCRSENWGKDKLLTNGQGAPKPILANAITALRYAPEWQDVLYFDEFSMATMVRHSPPWEGGAIVDRRPPANHRKPPVLRHFDPVRQGLGFFGNRAQILDHPRGGLGKAPLAVGL